MLILFWYMTSSLSNAQFDTIGLLLDCVPWEMLNQGSLFSKSLNLKEENFALQNSF